MEPVNFLIGSRSYLTYIYGAYVNDVVTVSAILLVALYVMLFYIVSGKLKQLAG